MIRPPMGLWSGGCSLAVMGSCGGGAVLQSPLDDGGGVVVAGPLGGSGGSGGHTVDPASGESGPASLAPSLGARVSVGRPRGLIWIRVVCLYGDLGGVDLGTGMISTGSSSLSSTAMTTTSSSSSSTTTSSSTPVTSSSPPPLPGDEDTGCHCVTGYGHEPYHGSCMAVPGDTTGSLSDLRVPSASRPVTRGRETVELE
jgi:hypothetical protein